MKPAFLYRAPVKLKTRDRTVFSVPTRVFLLAPCVDSQSRQRCVRMGGRNISTRFEDRGGVRVIHTVPYASDKRTYVCMYVHVCARRGQRQDGARCMYSCTL